LSEKLGQINGDNDDILSLIIKPPPLLLAYTS
jgi:hypothetical protein